MQDELARLKVLHDELGNLPMFPELIETLVREDRNVFRYRMEEGVSEATDLLTVPGLISCADWFNSAGAKFGKHAHKEKEWLLVYVGEIHLWYIECGVEHHKVLFPGDSHYNNPRAVHWAEFPIDTRYLAITIPDSPDWPKARRSIGGEDGKWK